MQKCARVASGQARHPRIVFEMTSLASQPDHRSHRTCELHILGEDRRVRVRPPLFVIGSREGSDLHFADPSVADSHAILLSIDGEWLVRHVGAGTVTLLNGEKVDQVLPRSGDTLTVGNFSMRILIGRDAVREAAPGDSLSSATREWGSLTRALTFVEEARGTIPARQAPAKTSIWRRLLGRA